MSSQRLTMDSPEFAGRIKGYKRRSNYERRSVMPVRPRLISDTLVAQSSSESQISPSTELTRQAPMINIKPHHSKSLNQPITSKPKLRKPSLNKLNVNHGLLIMAALIFIGGAGVALLGLKTDKQVKAQTKVLAKDTNGSANTGNNDVPDETKSDDKGNYQVAPDLPRYLRIASLGVNARVKRLGVKANNELQAPANIYDAGWYEGSAKPGDLGGAMLIDGHVHGPTQPGVFVGLKTLKPGASIEVERGDGKVFKYRVVKSQTYNANEVDMASALVPAEPGKLGLNLMTCTGKFDPKTNTYQQRIVVFAVAE